MSRRRLLPALVVAGLLATTGCSHLSTGEKGYVGNDGLITRVAPDQRKTPDTVEGTTLEGKHLSLKQYAGKVVVINVWGSWCPPCRAEAPTLVAAAKELAPEGVVFLGINTRDHSTTKGLAYQRRFEVPYPSLYDPDGRSLLAFRGTLNPSAIPSTVVIDQHGKVAASILDTVPTTRTLVDLVQDVQKS